MSLEHGASIVTNGLVLCLDAGNTKSYPGTGTTWTDLSGLGNNGTLTNGPTYSSANSGSLVFDGTNDNVSFGEKLNQTTSNFSMSAWVKSTSTAAGNNNGIIYKKYTGYSYIAGYRLNMPNGAFDVEIADGTSHSQLTAGSGYNNGTWWNVTATIIRGSSLNLYANGVLIGTAAQTFTTTIDSTGTPFCLASLAGQYHIYAGSMSYVSMYNRALSASEITQNFNALRGRYGI